MAKKKSLPVLPDNTLFSLVNLVEDSVKNYSTQQPKYVELAETLLDEITSEEMINLMDINTKIKTLELANKNILNPIESLTKLVQSVTALLERSEVNKSKQALDDLTDEIKSARDESIKSRTILAEILDEEDES